MTLVYECPIRIKKHVPTKCHNKVSFKSFAGDNETYIYLVWQSEGQFVWVVQKNQQNRQYLAQIPNEE
jgi:hypothetical protein